MLCPVEKLDETQSQRTVARANIAYLTVVLLNEDPRTTPDDALQPGVTGIEKLKKSSDG